MQLYLLISSFPYSGLPWWRLLCTFRTCGPDFHTLICHDGGYARFRTCGRRFPWHGFNDGVHAHFARVAPITILGVSTTVTMHTLHVQGYNARLYVKYAWKTQVWKSGLHVPNVCVCLWVSVYLSVTILAHACTWMRANYRETQQRAGTA